MSRILNTAALGILTVSLQLATAGVAQDSDFTVKIIKVHPHHVPTNSVSPAGEPSQSTAKTANETTSDEATVTRYTSRIVHGAPAHVVVPTADYSHSAQTAAATARPSVPGSLPAKSAATAQNQAVKNDSLASMSQASAARTQPNTVPAGQIRESDPIIVATVNDGMFQARIQSSDNILQSAPPLGRYEKSAVTSQAFRAFLEDNHGRVVAGKGEIIVFKGRWDKAEHLLAECGLAFSDANSREPEAQLEKAAIVVINCPGEMSERTLLALRTFVQKGGYLISTDWALDNCLAKAFPGYLVWKGAYSVPETVDAVPVLPGHANLSGIKGVAPWTLADKCEIVGLGGTGAVDILVRSRSLMREDPNRVGILAASFNYGTGRVLHLVGHFDNNEGLAFTQMLPDPHAPIKISMRQAIAINFIAEALQQAHAQKR